MCVVSSKYDRPRFLDRKPNRESFRPLFETLETRLALATVYGLTSNNSLISFDSATPGTITAPVAITGLGATEHVEDIDFRPRTGQLFGSTVSTGVVGSGNISTYVINPVTGVATLVGSTGNLLPGAADVATGYDFNPAVDRIRYVNVNNENARINPNNGSLAGDDPNLTFTAPATGPIIGSAYDRNFDRQTSPSPIPTTLYVIDRGSSQLGVQGGINGTAPGGPNGGAISAIGPLGVTLSNVADGGFDIVAGLNNSNGELGAAFAALTVGGSTGFYSINLTTGAATLVGLIGNGSTPLSGIAIAPPPLPTVSISDASATEGDDEVFNVTLSSPPNEQVTVRVNTASGSATGNVDYNEISPFVDVVFAPGEVTKQVVVSTIDDSQPEPNETFTLNVLFATNATVADGQGIGTIIDNDQLVCEVTTLNNPGTPGSAVLTDDADNPGQSALIVTGTAANDVIVIEPRPVNPSQIRVKINGHLAGIFPSADIQHIVAFGLAGNDTIVVNATLTQPASLFGDEGNDQLFGGRGADSLDGGSGNDRLFGGGGDDTLCGGDGNDFLYGQAGNDKLGGDGGNDKLFGEAGNDLLLGGDGNDKLYGGTGNDKLFGQAGNDKLFGENGNDILVGGTGNDQLFGGTGRDVLIGGDGNDLIVGEAHDDILVAGSTTHDEDPDALAAILAEWTSANSYATRVNNIRNGGGANGAIALDSSSVLDDGLVDTLIGNGGLDWFLFGSGDKVKDKTAAELAN